MNDHDPASILIFGSDPNGPYTVNVCIPVDKRIIESSPTLSKILGTFSQSINFKARTKSGLDGLAAIQGKIKESVTQFCELDCFTDPGCDGGFKSIESQFLEEVMRPGFNVYQKLFIDSEVLSCRSERQKAAMREYFQSWLEKNGGKRGIIINASIASFSATDGMPLRRIVMPWGCLNDDPSSIQNAWGAKYQIQDGDSADNRSEDGFAGTQSELFFAVDSPVESADPLYHISNLHCNRWQEIFSNSQDCSFELTRSRADLLDP